MFDVSKNKLWLKNICANWRSFYVCWKILVDLKIHGHSKKKLCESKILMVFAKMYANWPKYMLFLHSEESQ